MMRRAIAHHPLTWDQHLASLRAAIPCPHFPVPILDVTSHGMEYPFGQFGSAALVVSPHSFLCPFLLASCWLGMRS